MIACAVSDSGAVGIDIETATFSDSKAGKLAERFFDATEKLEVESSPEQFTRVWTRKEAIAKYFGANLADFLKKSSQNDEISKISLHNFKFGKHPVTLCTARDFDKIILLGDTRK